MAARDQSDTARSWQPRDCHAHTRHSDGALTPQDLVNVVRERGVRPGIADHCSRDVSKSISDLTALAAYLHDLESIGGDLAIGAEFCWHDTLWREIPDFLSARFTHRVGSLHAVPLAQNGRIHAFQKSLPAGMTRAQYMNLHIAELELMMAEMPVDIFAHPGLVPIPLRRVPGEELWSEEHEERAVNAIVKSGIAFELSNRYPAHDRLLRRAHAAGVRFSLGSDGHTFAQVGDVTAPLGLARSLGVRDADLYDPFTHGSRVPRT